MKKLLSIICLLSTLCANAQESSEVNAKNTSINLTYGVNLTYSSVLESRSIGGDWGLSIDHQLPNKRIGFSGGINYSLTHVGFDNEFTSPSNALEFWLLESAFGVFVNPFQDLEGFRIRLGYSHALVVQNENFFLEQYNIPMLTSGFEYLIPTKSSLALAVGLNNKLYRLSKNEFGTNLTSVIYFKFGLKN